MTLLDSSERDARRLRYEQVKGFSSFGCFGPESPPAGRALKRFVAEISFEDSSDVSDYWLDFDTFAEAEQAHRAIRIVDLDTGSKWTVEWLQRGSLDED